MYKTEQTLQGEQRGTDGDDRNGGWDGKYRESGNFLLRVSESKEAECTCVREREIDGRSIRVENALRDPDVNGS